MEKSERIWLDGIPVPWDAARDRGLAMGCLPRRRGHATRHPGEDELVPALSSEHAPHQGEGGRPLRELDPGLARGARGRLRRGVAPRRRRLRVRGERGERLPSERRGGEDDAAPHRARGHHAPGGAAVARRSGVTAREERFTRDEIYLADEAFL